jgi:PST family polysaccharide transporter/lipopolysaccharide exporter
MRAVFPGYAMMSSDPARLAQGFVTVFSLVLLFALPAAAGIALLAEPLVSVLLGPRWADAASLLQVLAVYGGIRAAQANTGSVYMALDRPQLASAMTLLNVLLAFGSFAVALGRMPLADAAWWMVAGAGVAAVVNLSVLTRSLGQSWSTVLAALRRPALAIAAMTAALLPLRAWLWTGGQPIHERAAVLLCLVLAGATVYLAALLAAWHAQGRPADSPENAALKLVNGLLRGRTT